MLFQNHFLMHHNWLKREKNFECGLLNAGCSKMNLHCIIISTVLEEFSFSVCSPLKYVVALSYLKMSFMAINIQKIMNRIVVAQSQICDSCYWWGCNQKKAAMGIQNNIWRDHWMDMMEFALWTRFFDDCKSVSLRKALFIRDPTHSNLCIFMCDKGKS